MSLYVENNLLSNQGGGCSDFIAAVAKTEATVRQAEVALFQEQNQVVALDEEAKSAVAVIKQLENEINETEAELAGNCPLGNAPEPSAVHKRA